MLISDKQKAANKANAKKSTGPKSKQGKKSSSQNAVKHALYAKDIIVDSPNLKENPDDYQSLLDSHYDDFLPVGQFEEDLVTKIANCIWRARRAYHAESAQIRRQLRRWDPIDDTKPLDDDAQRRRNLIGYRSIPDDESSRHIQRYEMRLDRQLCRAYSLLICLQQRRKSDMVENLKQGNILNMRNEPLLIAAQQDTPPNQQIPTPE